MRVTELTSVTLAIILAIALGVSLFAGNQKEKLTLKAAMMMVVTGLVAGVITWTYLSEGESTKVIVRNILIYTFSATVFAKLIGRVITSLTNIPEKEIQKIGLDYLRRKVGLNETENAYETEGDASDFSVSRDSDGVNVDG